MEFIQIAMIEESISVPLERTRPVSIVLDGFTFESVRDCVLTVFCQFSFSSGINNRYGIKLEQ